MTTELATTPDNPLALLGSMDLATVEPDKLAQLLDLQAKWEDRQADKALQAALAQFQADTPMIFKGRKSNNSTFASLDDILKVIRPHMAKAGLSVSFDTETRDGKMTAICHVMHEAGSRFERRATVPVDSQMRANESQKMGSAISYAKRYALTAALNLIVSDQDDDGAAAGTETITPAQVKKLQSLIDAADDLTVADRLLQWAGVQSLEEIPASKFKQAVKGVEGK